MTNWKNKSKKNPTQICTMWKTETLFLCKLWREKRAIPIHITEWKSSNFYAKHKVKIEPFLRRVLRKIFLVIQIIRLDKKGVFLFGQSFLVTFLLFQNISVQVRLYAKNTICPFSTLHRFNSYFNNSLRSLYLSIPLSPFQTSFIPHSFYVPERSIMHLIVSARFLISSGRGGE